MSDFRYRHFIYLDSDEILSVAAIMEGGQVGEELHTLTKGFGGNIGAKLGFAALGASLGLHANRLFKKEWKLRRTAYVAADKVLKQLAPKEMTREKTLSMPENTVVWCDIDLHPLCSRSNGEQPHRDVKQLVYPWWRKVFIADPAVEVRRQNVYDYGKRQTMEVSMLGDEGDELEHPRLLLVFEPQWVLKPGEFSRRATVVGQIVGVKRHGEELVPSCDNYGPWFKFCRHSAPASTDQPSKSTLPSPRRMSQSRLLLLLVLLLLGATTAASPSNLPSNAPPEDSQSQARGQYPLDVQEGHKGRWWIFRRKHEKAGADVEAAANIDLGLHRDRGDERIWHASVVLRPIVIFK